MGGFFFVWVGENILIWEYQCPAVVLILDSSPDGRESLSGTDIEPGAAIAENLSLEPLAGR